MFTPKVLNLLSFTDTEKSVWESLSAGSFNITELASLSKFPRTTLYTALTSLKKRGMISTRSKGKSVIVSPTLSNHLSDLLSESATAFREEGTVKVIKKTKNEFRSGFTFIYGKKSMLKVWERMAEKGIGKFYSIQPTRSMMNTIKLFKPGEFIPINDAIKKNKIVVEGIGREDGFPAYMNVYKDNPKMQKNIIDSFMGRMTDMTLVKNNYLNNNAELLFTSRSAFLMNWEQEIGIEIENRDMIDFLKELFELAKGYGRKIDFNEYLKEWLDKLQK